jgi:hypothetical protein
MNIFLLVVMATLPLFGVVPLVVADSLQNRTELPVAEENLMPPFATDETTISLNQDPVKKLRLFSQNGDSRWEYFTRYRVEMLFANNFRFLNDENNVGDVALDRIMVPARHTLDFNLQYDYGIQSRGYAVLTFKTTLRNKANWGAPDSVFSTEMTGVKHIESVIGEHSHPILRHVIWIREMWLEVVLDDLINRKCNESDSKHLLTLGFFPFQLGRGIALGSAYGVDPDFVGWYSPNSIDQFAPGFKLSGDFTKHYGLKYDVYLEIMSNKSDTFDNVNAKVAGQILGRRFNQSRGFGKINYLIAGRLLWSPFDEPCKKLIFEPYGLFNDQREQKVEFLGDAQGKLGTFGLSMEAEYGKLEIGFDTAFNVGRQHIFASDRNTIVEEIRQGVGYFVNTHVIATEGAQSPNIPHKRAVFTPEDQKLINDPKLNCASHNDCLLGNYLKNSPHRFTKDYCIGYHGAMFVGDMSYWLYKRTIKFSLTGGFATGDKNPHQLRDEDHPFKGFVSLQELYSGTRVKSAFVLSGQGRIPRPVPASLEFVEDPFPTSISRFANLIFGGGGLYARVPGKFSDLELNPNILAFWNYVACNRYDSKDHKFTGGPTSKFLGVEFNMFFEKKMWEDFRVFGVGSIFVPGKFFDDIAGLPLNKSQEKYLDSLNTNGSVMDRIPIVGRDRGISLNIGFEYTF